MSALRLINETTGTSVSSISVTDVFTSDFDIYKIEANGLGTSTEDWTSLRFLNTSGSAISTTNYLFAMWQMKSYTAFGSSTSTAGNKFNYLWIDTSTASGFGNIIYVFNPMSSAYTFMLGQSSGNATGGNIDCKYIGALKETTQISGIQFTRYSGTYSDISIRTYGLRVDNG